MLDVLERDPGQLEAAKAQQMQEELGETVEVILV